MFSPSVFKMKNMLVSPYIQIPENISEYDFDTYLINECFVLKNIAGYIFKNYLTKFNFEMDEEVLVKFIDLVCENYNRNYFHNFQHSVNVLHMTYKLLNATGLIYKLKPIVIFATLISAISHDVDHPGNTNSYEINSFSKYAKLYNDISVLENHHCTLTFELLEYSGLMGLIKTEDFKDFRKTIISAILGTDMSKHNDFIIKFKNFQFEVDEFSSDDQYFIAQSIVHCADLSNSIKDFNISLEWSKRISLEFYQQTVKEELEGLPILSFMKVHDNLSMCLNEINFITNISMPMWQLFAEKFEGLYIILDRCKRNLENWKKIECRYLDENDINTLNY